jgi:hypothetical protein
LHFGRSDYFSALGGAPLAPSISMNAKSFRRLVLFCCTAAAGFVAAGVYCYVGALRVVEQSNTPENIARFGVAEFRAPEITSNAFYIAGLFLALGGCFWLKACRAEPSDVAAQIDEPSIGDEN